MPELPEVQTIVNGLNRKIIGRRITGVWFDWPKIIKKPKPKELEKQIKGLKILKIKRRGKNILIHLNKCQMSNVQCQMFLLLIHQKLTGHLLYGKWRIVNRKATSLIKGPLQEKVNDYIHLIFYLDNGFQFALSDLRKFAKVLFGPTEEIENLPDLKNLGPEPLDKSFSFSIFQSAILKNKRKIKQVLMDQEVIAGIGNIYSDEILWQAKIHPFKQANKLKANQLKALYLAIRQILNKALKLRGTSISDFRDIGGKAGAYTKMLKVYPHTKLRYGVGVYRREGEKCPRCGGIIKRVKIGGRSAHFCLACQRLKP